MRLPAPHPLPTFIERPLRPTFLDVSPRRPATFFRPPLTPFGAAHHRLCVQNLQHFSCLPPRLEIFPFKLYNIGEGITEVEVLKWHVKVGQKVEDFDDLCVVQSDKSVVYLLLKYELSGVD